MALRSRFTIAAVALLVPVLAGCATSFKAQTDQVYDPTRGVTDRSGEVYVLNALVVSPDDGTGTVAATLVNTDIENADRLTGVTVEGAEATVDAADGAADIPAGGSNNLAASGAVSVSAGAIEAGNFVSVTFTFQRAGAITVDAPVVPHDGDYADVPVAQAG